MTRVFLTDDEGRFMLVDDPAPPEEVRNEIMLGRWAPKIPQPGPLVSATIREDTIFIYPIKPSPKKPTYNIPKLSAREMQVLEGLVNGLEYKEIAVANGISPRTVKDYVEQLKGKFNTQSNTSVVARAVAMDICKPHLE